MRSLVMRLRELALLVGLSLMPDMPLFAQAAPTSNVPALVQRPPLLPVTDFTERTGLSELILSPDGGKIALKAVGKDGKVSLAVLDAANRKALHNLTMPEKNELEWFRWAGPDRVLVSLSQLGKVLDVEVRFTRLFVYDLTARTFSYVGKKHMGVDGDELLFSDPAGQFVLLSVEPDLFSWPSVWRFSLDGTAEKSAGEVQAPWSGVYQWVTDSTGVVRLGYQFISGGSYKVIYRSSAKDSFRTVARYNREQWEQVPFLDLWVVPGSDQGYALHDGEGRTVLRRFDFATFAGGEVIHAQPGADLADVTFDDQQKPLAAVYTDDRDQIVWFDPSMKTLHTNLQKALKGSNVWIGSYARDHSRMLVWAGSENDPGVWYLYHAKERRLDLFYVEKPKLVPEQMAKPRPITYTARDGIEIKGYLTLPPGREPKNLPLIVLPHGGPYGVRDKLRFDTEAQFLANRGYAVLQPNFRGSSGYGEEFELLGDGQIGRKMQDDLDDGMDWTIAQGIADPKRVCLVGSSYGGYAALWGVIRNPERYRCAASFAGVTDFNAILSYDGRFLSRFSYRKWRQRIRGDAGGFNLDTVSPTKQASRLTRPILLVHGEKDTRVPFKQFKSMRDAAARTGMPIEVLTFADEGHGFDKAENETKWLETLERFLRKYSPAD